MTEEKKIYEIVEECIADTPYFLVGVEVSADNVISVEIDSEESVSLDYCIELSKKIESKLDRDQEDFELNVGSAGLTSPFKVLRQYKKYEGQEVEVQVKNGPKYVGVLVNVTENDFGVETTRKEKKEGEKKKVDVTEVVTIAYDQVAEAKYSLKFK
jgi:ribosome maturation factor RimP